MIPARRALVPVFVAAALALPGGDVTAQDAGWRAHPDKSPVSYAMEVELQETGFDAVRLVGKETAVWENTSRDSVRVLYLHAYANAFRNTRSTFLREATRDGMEIPDDMKFADMRIGRMTSAHGDELPWKWVAPDDGNADDRTVLRVELPQAVEAGEKLPLKIEFTLEMPHVLRRMGAQNGFVMAAQWYPKLGMYLGAESTMRDVHEGWFCHQFHANTEFAADFADYDVTLKFPSEYKVGATGTPAGSDSLDEKKGVTTRRYKADGVVDFAWTAGRQFVEFYRDISPTAGDRLDDPVAAESRRVRSLLGVSADDVALPTTRVVLLLQPEHVDQAERHFEAARVALGMFGAWLGPYPYQRLTIVDPPWSAKAGGMEYPMLVTAGTTVGAPPETQHPESVTVHEICHQWLMGILANNEAEEAWLDEGINSYLTAQAMHRAYHGAAQQSTDLLGFHFPGVPVHEFPGVSTGWPEALGLPGWARPPKIELFRIWRDVPWLTYVSARRYESDPILPFRRSWVRRAGVDEMVKPGWLYFDRTSYQVNAYARPALFLDTLHKSLVADGDLDAEEADRLFLRAIREYAREFRFRHPTTEDFLAKFKEIAGDPTPAAEQLIRSASTLDYSVESIRSGADPDFVGRDDRGELVRPAKKTAKDKAADAAPKSSIVRVERRGDAVVTIVLEIAREHGKTERVRWEAKDQAKERWRDFRFDGTVVSARLDPDGVYLQDVDLSNGSRTSEPNLRPAVKWSVRFLDWIENAFVGYGRFF
jgi:hypothetical protein